MMDQHRLTTLYQGQDFVHLPKLISPDRAAQLHVTTSDVPVRKVKCGDENTRFGEQSFDHEHPVSRFFMTEEFTRLALALTGARKVSGITCWTSVYRVGEFIDPHTDASGSIQILICLQAPSAATNGGHLILRPNTQEQVKLGLSPGDTVAFKATAVRHCTTPLISSPEQPDPVRVVAVARYFTANV